MDISAQGLVMVPEPAEERKGRVHLVPELVEGYKNSPPPFFAALFVCEEAAKREMLRLVPFDKLRDQE